MELADINSVEGNEAIVKRKISLTYDELDQVEQLYAALAPISPDQYERRFKMADVYRFVVMMFLSVHPTFPESELDGMIDGDYVRKNILIRKSDFEKLSEFVGNLKTRRKFGVTSALRLFIKYYTPYMLDEIKKSREFDILNIELRRNQ